MDSIVCKWRPLFLAAGIGCICIVGLYVLHAQWTSAVAVSVYAKTLLPPTMIAPVASALNGPSVTLCAVTVLLLLHGLGVMTERRMAIGLVSVLLVAWASVASAKRFAVALNETAKRSSIEIPLATCDRIVQVLDEEHFQLIAEYSGDNMVHLVVSPYDGGRVAAAKQVIEQKGLGSGCAP